ncbi:MAG: glycosyltransferase family 9 protein [candidate division Zixibacteria bacterium]|nr:glycosyltransferase family 9 protein [candidate division Zixibacteria bacterium]
MSIRHILLIRLRYIGDAVLTLPLVRALQAAFPKAELCYLAEPGPASLLIGQPGIDEVIVLDRAYFAGLSPLRRFREHLKFFSMLRRQRFDLVIDLFGNPRSALLAYASGAPQRMGFDVRGRGMAYNLKIQRGDSPWATDAYLDAARTLGIAVTEDRPRLHVSEATDRWAADFLETHELFHRRLPIGLYPGASWPAKKWPAHRFAEIADRLTETFGASVVLVCGPQQEMLVKEIQNHMKSPALVAGPVDLPLIAALIRRLRLFISNDGGPMHIAAAVGTPTVGIFGPSRPDIWFPYPEKEGYMALKSDRSDCCGKDFCDRATPCIEDISVARVFEAATEALRATERPA